MRPARHGMRVSSGYDTPLRYSRLTHQQDAKRMALQRSEGRGDVRWLSFRLRNGQSISPTKLLAGWGAATAMPGCSVRRESVLGAGMVYALYAPDSLASPRRAEMSMRRFLEEEGYAFTMGSLGSRATDRA